MLIRRLVARGYRNLVAPGFSVEVHIGGGPVASVAATYSGRKKRITVDGEEMHRLTRRVGRRCWPSHWRRIGRAA